MDVAYEPTAGPSGWLKPSSIIAPSQPLRTNIPTSTQEKLSKFAYTGSTKNLNNV